MELQRLLKVEAGYLNLLMTHFGGKEEKMKSFMRTNLVRAECPEIVIDHWNWINTFRLDESTMFLLCKLLVSPLLIKSKKMLIEFLNGTLSPEDASNSINDDKFMMAPKKIEKDQQILTTPENTKKGGARNKPSTFEHSFIRKIDFDDPTNKTGNHLWMSFPDLAEKKENQNSVTLADVNLELFTKHRTSVNEGARIVRTEEGAFLACASSLSNGRFCHMHKFNTIKKCERPCCPRYIFPQVPLKLKLLERQYFIQEN